MSRQVSEASHTPRLLKLWWEQSAITTFLSTQQSRMVVVVAITINTAIQLVVASATNVADTQVSIACITHIQASDVLTAENIGNGSITLEVTPSENDREPRQISISCCCAKDLEFGAPLPANGGENSRLNRAGIRRHFMDLRKMNYKCPLGGVAICAA